MADYTLKALLQGIDNALGGILSSLSGVPSASGMTPGGRLTVPPAHIQPTGDNAVQLDSANDKIALIYSNDVDEIISSLSVYLKTIATTGDMTLGLYDTVKGVIADGSTNQCATSNLPLMPTKNTPAGHEVDACNYQGNKGSGVSYNTGYVPDYVFDGTYGHGSQFISAALPTAEQPFYLYRSVPTAIVVNKTILFCEPAGSNRFIKAFTFWGSAAETRPTEHTDDGWTQLGSWSGLSNTLYQEFTFTNSTAYKHFRIKCTDANNDLWGCGQWILVEAETVDVPNTLLQDLGALAVGSSNGVWLRQTFTGYQLQRDKVYAIVGGGAASKDFTVSTRRVNISRGSSLPYNCQTLITTDGGTTWTRAYQDVVWQPACWNIILNSTANHVPQLVYGRVRGTKVPLYTSDAWELATIPAGGVWLNCEGLTADTEHQVYLYNNSGTLTLEASTTGTVLQDGMEVMSGATNKLRVGRIIPRTRQTGYQGPIMVKDDMLVSNLYNPKTIVIGKSCPFSADTTAPALTVATGNLFFPIFHAEQDLACRFVCEQGRAFSGFIPTGNGTYGLVLMVDGRVNADNNKSNSDRGFSGIIKCMTEGLHTIIPGTSAAQAGSTYICKISTREYSFIGISATVEA